MAKAMKKPRNSHFWLASSGIRPTRSLNAKLLVPAVTYRPMTEASMSRPPKREYRKNFIAAYCRRGPPNRPMMKYIGMSMASKKT